MLLHFLQQYLWSETTGEKWSLVPLLVLLSPLAHHLSVLPLTSLSPNVHPAIETIRHSSQSPTNSWNLPIRIFGSLLSLVPLFASLAPSPSCPPPLCTVWGMVYEHRDLMSHSRSWTKTRTYGEIFTGCVTLTHRSPVSSFDFFFFLPNVIVLFPLCSTWFIRLDQQFEWGYSSQLWNKNYMHVCRHELPYFTSVKTVYLIHRHSLAH